MISHRDEILPYALRLGVRPSGEAPEIPAHYWRTVKRMEFSPKTLINIDYFRESIAGPCPLIAILLGERRLRGPSFLRAEPPRRVLEGFLHNAIVGLGLYQGVEFLLESSPWELLGRTGLALSRLRNSLQAIKRSQVYRFAMGPDAEESGATLLQFIQEFSTQGQKQS